MLARTPGATALQLGAREARQRSEPRPTGLAHSRDRPTLQQVEPPTRERAFDVDREAHCASHSSVSRATRSISSRVIACVA